MEPQLYGIHHVTCVTADPRENRRFYCDLLGMRLVKKTVNQDDVSAYHLFYGDGPGSAGSDITFFHWPVAPERRGSRSVIETGLRLASRASLEWWRERLTREGLEVGQIGMRAGRAHLSFEDREGQRLAFVVDESGGVRHAWDKSPVPAEHQILGLGPPVLAVPRPDKTGMLLTAIMQMRLRSDLPAAAGPHGSALAVYEMGSGGAHAEVHVVEDSGATAGQGAGSVHHIAFRTPDVAGLSAWAQRVSAIGIRSSGEVERYYFRSLYFREPGGVLFEIATDTPGFAVDEPMAVLGERLSLPPFLEGRRAEIEAGLSPL